MDFFVANPRISRPCAAVVTHGLLPGSSWMMGMYPDDPFVRRSFPRPVSVCPASALRLSDLLYDMQRVCTMSGSVNRDKVIYVTLHRDIRNVIQDATCGRVIYITGIYYT